MAKARRPRHGGGKWHIVNIATGGKSKRALFQGDSTLETGEMADGKSFQALFGRSSIFSGRNQEESTLRRAAGAKESDGWVDGRLGNTLHAQSRIERSCIAYYDNEYIELLLMHYEPSRTVFSMSSRPKSVVHLLFRCKYCWSTWWKIEG